MRLRRLLVRAWPVSFAVAAVGCGDGVGRPILETERQDGVVSGTGGISGVGGAGPSGGNGSGFGSGGSRLSPEQGNGGVEFGPPRTAGESGWDDWVPREPLEKGVVPEGAHCDPASNWEPAADAAEQELVQFLNFARGSGLRCARNTQAPELEVIPELRCAARLHSRDMSERGFFEHVNPDGVGPEERMRRSGVTFRVASESIARDEQGGPGGGPRWRELSQLLMDGGADCKNVADPGFDRVGVGFYDGLVTLDFAGP